jgi:uncharacterized membrane protein YhaH (DUF805 family)
MLSPAQVKELFSYRGRASKHQFRMMVLFLLVLLWFFGVLCYVPKAGLNCLIAFLSPTMLFFHGSLLQVAPVALWFYVANGVYTLREIVYDAAFMVIPSIIMYSISIPLIIRRYHDLNISGWRLLLDIVPFTVGFNGFLFVFTASFANDTVFFRGQGQLAQDLISKFLFLAFLGAGFYFYRLYTFFFVDGTVGPNRFGKNPIDPSMPD